MGLHPAEVAKELKHFHFFRTFPEDLLLQLATLIKPTSFAKGETILNEGDENHLLHFLRKGHAEVMLGNEVVTILQHLGEVIGEMSVVTQRPVSTTIRAAVDVECFTLNTQDFSYVPAKDQDHFLHLLYRIYSNILADRLIRTNDKARLFEIANRELHQAQVALEKTGDKRVLLVERDKKQLALAKMALGATGVHLDTASEFPAALELVATNKYDAIVADETCLDFLRQLREQKTSSRLVMMMTKDVRSNLSAIKDMMDIDHMMTRDPEDRQLTIRNILTTLSKVLSHEFFGLEKYLSWGVEVQSRVVKASTEREKLRDEMCADFKKRGVRSTILQRVNTVAEELLMNAIYDAPADSTGKPLFNHMTRRTEILLETHLQSTLRYASDGVMLAVSVTDPFGSLTKDIILRYLEGCYRGDDVVSGHEGKGGAGKGLHQIVENSDLTIFNVRKGTRTEVICLFLVEGHKKEPQPSFHYFFA